jgi:hypothetical protein
MKKIVAHIQRTVTITTIHTTLEVSVSDDDPNALVIPLRNPAIASTIPEGEKIEKNIGDSIRGPSARRKPARGVRTNRSSKRKSNRSGG